MSKKTEVVKERPILMNTDMVRAILSGRKIQTRRPIKRNDSGGVRLAGRNWHLDDPNCVKACPFGQIGYRLWVRERWATDANVDALPPRMIPQKVPVYYYATAQCKNYRWRPSIHMPRWASRITLEIVDVRVERIGEISEEDAVNDGVQKSRSGELWCGAPHKVHGFPRQHNTAKEAFLDIWNFIYSKRGLGLDTNPWVWVIEFRRVE